MNKVAVVVPIHRAELTPREHASLAHNVEILNGQRLIFVLSEEIGVTPSWLDSYPEAQIIRVSSEWLGSANGIAGYNRMMLSGEFYRLFADHSYMLVCQTDVWLFRNELDLWCDLGYDYVGGPYYDRIVTDKVFTRKTIEHVSRRDGRGRVLNGGLSLRRIQAFTDACERYADEIEYFLERSARERGVATYSEDWFWSLVPELKRPYPSLAREFSIDTHPKRNWIRLGRRLPFGCHGWWKRRRYSFWSPIIGL